MKQRFELIDFAKGVSIILVILGHCIQISYTNSDFQTNPMFDFIYTFHMPLFFFLSGVTFYFYKDKKLFSLLIARAKNLLIPFLAWPILAALVLGLFYYKNILSYILNYIQQPGIGLWFLLVLFDMILFTLVIYKALEVINSRFLKRSKNLVFIILIPISVLLIFTPGITEVLGINLFKNHYLFFVLGFFAISFKNVFYPRIKLLLNITLISLGAILLIYPNLPTILDKLKLLSLNIQSLILLENIKILCLIFLSLFLIKLIYDNFIRLRKYFIYIGLISLDIYVIHRSLIFDFGVSIIRNSDVPSVIFSTIFFLIISIIISYLIKKSSKPLSLLFLGKS